MLNETPGILFLTQYSSLFIGHKTVFTSERQISVLNFTGIIKRSFYSSAIQRAEKKFNCLLWNGFLNIDSPLIVESIFFWFSEIFHAHPQYKQTITIIEIFVVFLCKPRLRKGK